MRLFVTVGNARDPFDRLVDIVDRALDLIATPVTGVFQFGSCRQRSRHLEGRQMLSQGEFEAELHCADVVVMHAGVGSIASAIRAGHCPLVVARRSSFGEIVNDHQLEIVDALARSGRVVPIATSEELATALARYARGELRRAPPTTTDCKRLQPIAEVLKESVTRRRDPGAGHLLLRAIGALAPYPKIC